MWIIVILLQKIQGHLLQIEKVSVFLTLPVDVGLVLFWKGKKKMDHSEEGLVF